MLVTADFSLEKYYKTGETLGTLMAACCTKWGERPAIDGGEETLSYQELGERSNQLARYLLDQGIGSGDRVGLLLDKSFTAYICLFAITKINATYVPFDPSFPNERIDFMSQDAEIKAILSLNKYEKKLSGLTTKSLLLDSAESKINSFDNSELKDYENPDSGSQLSYIIYTSGTTGNPKGVEIEHASIVNFVRVATEIYGYTEHDRVYQGLTLAFDFAVEELWLPLYAGSTLVPPPSDAKLLEADLRNFLFEKKITALCCVPTLLATIESDLPELRLLILSGEACPQDLVNRWHNSQRTLLNVYGPTEATVTATWTELKPNKPVSIGIPLPGYTIVILDAEKNEVVEDGKKGEICIAGVGLAKGYLNLPERTQQSFIPDFLDIPHNPSKRIYRSGDLGRINENGEVDCLGRIDSQVKISGYRIELGEIESEIMQVPDVAQAVVDVYEPESGNKQLVAYYSQKPERDLVAADTIYQTIKGKLPKYMMPVYYQPLDSIPLTNNDKADRKKLPDPMVERFIVSTNYVAPKSEIEKQLEKQFKSVLKLDRVSIADNFFEELGADSLLIARFCTQVRTEHNIPIAITDVYQNPTIKQLGEALEQKKTADEATAQTPIREKTFYKPSAASYWLCGALQLLYYLSRVAILLGLTFTSLSWILQATTPTEILSRSLGVNLAIFVGWVLLSVASKWVLIGRWKESEIKIWSLNYFRFWLVKQMVSFNPIVLFRGTPLYNVYLRLLGAKIGKNAVVEPLIFPLCTDLLTIGDDSIINKDVLIPTYHAQGNIIYTGSTNIGDNCYIGEGSVLEIETQMENETQLGYASYLAEGQSIPAGKNYHGSPAQETSNTYGALLEQPHSKGRKFAYSCLQLSAVTLLPALTFLVVISIWPYSINDAVSEASLLQSLTLDSSQIIGKLRASSIYFGYLLILLSMVIIVPRLLSFFICEDKVYKRYGFHFLVFKLIRLTSNSQRLNIIFGDSSFIIYYLRWIGYKLPDVVQSGSNFGVNQKHDNPHLCTVKTGTMVSDGLSIINSVQSSSAFECKSVAISKNNYLGNNLFFSADSKVGDNCLLATKVLLPIAGKEKENTGLLGSPSVDIPRVAERDQLISEKYKDPEVLRAGITKKNAHNFLTVISYLFFQWFNFFGLLLASSITIELYKNLGVLAASGFAITYFIIVIGYAIMVERIGMFFGKLKTQTMSIYEKSFWEVEYAWKHSSILLPTLFKGTPFRGMIYKLTNVKTGKMIFDNGIRLTEKPLVSIGDYANLNERSTAQSHSLEEGAYKSAHIHIGNGVTLGVNAFVHYGVTLSDNSTACSDSFVMKGSTTIENETWGGNPARPL